MKNSDLLAILNKIAEEYFKRKVDESKAFKLSISFIGKKIEKNIMEVSDEEKMEKIHSLFLHEMKDVESIIYIHSMILRTSYKITSANSFIDFLRSKSEQLLGLFFQSSEQQTRVYDQLMSEYNLALDSLTSRNSPLNPASIQIILNDRENYLLFERLVYKWFPQTKNKLLIQGLIYSLSWMFKPKRKELIEFAPLPTNFHYDRLVLLFCYTISIENVPVEVFGELLGLIERNKPQSFQELLKLDDMSLNKLMIRIGMLLDEKKMQYDFNSKLDALSKQILILTTKQEVSDMKLEKTQQELRTTKKELEETQQELGATKKELEETKKELGSTKKELEETKKQLEETQQELGATKKELEETRKEVEETKKQLEETQQELEATKKELEKTKTELEKIQQELGATKKELEKTQQESIKEELLTTKKILEEMVRRHKEVFSTLSNEVAFGAQMFKNIETLNDKTWSTTKLIQEKNHLEKKVKQLQLELANKVCKCCCKCSSCSFSNIGTLNED